LEVLFDTFSFKKKYYHEEMKTKLRCATEFFTSARYAEGPRRREKFIRILNQNPSFVTGREPLPQQGFGSESEVLFDAFSFKKKYEKERGNL